MLVPYDNHELLPMNPQSLVLTVASSVSIIAYTVAITTTAHAQESAVASSDSPPITFSCEVIDDLPNTVARTTHNNQEIVPIFRWDSDYYSETGEDSLTRCIRASALLEVYNQMKLLNYIKTEIIDGMPRICVANAPPEEELVDNSCGHELFIFKPGDTPEPVVKLLRQVLNNTLSEPQPSEDLSLSESESPQRIQPESRTDGLIPRIPAFSGNGTPTFNNGAGTR